MATGDLAANGGAFLLLMGYARRRCIERWRRACVVENDRVMEACLMPEGYRARPEQLILLTIDAWDTNSPQHISRMFDGGDVACGSGRMRERLAAFEAENTERRQQNAIERTAP